MKESESEANILKMNTVTHTSTKKHLHQYERLVDAVTPIRLILNGNRPEDLSCKTYNKWGTLLLHDYVCTLCWCHNSSQLTRQLHSGGVQDHEAKTRYPSHLTVTALLW